MGAVESKVFALGVALDFAAAMVGATHPTAATERWALRERATCALLLCQRPPTPCRSPAEIMLSLLQAPRHQMHACARQATTTLAPSLMVSPRASNARQGPTAPGDLQIPASLPALSIRHRQRAQWNLQTVCAMADTTEPPTHARCAPRTTSATAARSRPAPRT